MQKIFRQKIKLVILILLITITSNSYSQTWHKILNEPNISAFEFDPMDNNTFYIGTFNDVYTGTSGKLLKTTDNGLSWDTLITNYSVTAIEVHPKNTDIIYIGSSPIWGSPSAVLKTFDEGKNWFYSDSGMILTSDNMIGPLVMDPLNPDTLYVGTGGFLGGSLYKTENGGNFWRTLKIIDNSGPLLINKYKHNELYYIESFLNPHIVYKSTDYGETFYKIMNDSTFPVDPINSGFYSLNIYPENTDNLIISGNTLLEEKQKQIILKGIKMDTFDYRWEIIHISPDSVIYGNIEIYNDIFYTTIRYYDKQNEWKVGVIKSTDQGENWNLVDTTGIEQTEYTGSWILIDKRVYPPVFYLYTKTGLYTADLISCFDNEHEIISFNYAISYNYPNPFNNSTNIMFYINNKRNIGRIKIDIYDITGEKINKYTLTNSKPGFNTIIWNGKEFNGNNISSGIYIYKIFINGLFYDTGKMVYLK